VQTELILVNAVLREIAATARHFPERLLPTAYIMKYGRERESDFRHPTFLPDLCLCAGRNNLCHS
jgi:hypothetical protein